MEVIDLKFFLEDPDSEDSKRECQRAANLLKQYGALAVRDPRVTFEDNNAFLDQLERYFTQPPEQILDDSRPELHYQVGVTPEGVETPRCIVDPRCAEKISTMNDEDKALMPNGPDVKWRFFHKLGERPKETQFEGLNSPNVIPKAFPTWIETMENWGLKLLSSGYTLAEMAAVGLGLPRNTFTELFNCAPHLLAPTASNLEVYGKKNQILAGFHQDLNFVTMHGKSRFPGLHIWLRNGKKFPVSIPDGCLLAQVGMQFEYLTGGEVLAGYHEVVVTDKTLEAIERAKAKNGLLWRISSTVFIHVASDKLLRPLLGGPEVQEKYPPILAGEQVANELKVLKLSKKK